MSTLRQRELRRTEVMRLHHAGISVEEIARRLSLTPIGVGKMITRYSRIEREQAEEARRTNVAGPVYARGLIGWR
jgi:hypothetical protein